MCHCSSAISPHETGLQQEKYHGLGYVVDRPVPGVESGFSYSPLLHHDYRPFPEFRGYNSKVQLQKNLDPSFEDTELEETYMPSLSGHSERYTKRQAS